MSTVHDNRVTKNYADTVKSRLVRATKLIKDRDKRHDADASEIERLRQEISRLKSPSRSSSALRTPSGKGKAPLRRRPVTTGPVSSGPLKFSVKRFREGTSGPLLREYSSNDTDPDDSMHTTEEDEPPEVLVETPLVEREPAGSAPGLKLVLYSERKIFSLLDLGRS